MEKNVPEATVQRWRKFTDLVLSLSKKGLIPWKETSTENKFLANYKGYIILVESIEHSPQHRGQPIIIVTIEDKEGRTIDEFDDEDISNDTRAYYPDLRDLVLSMQRLQTGADDILDSLISDMEKKVHDDETPVLNF